MSISATRDILWEARETVKQARSYARTLPCSCTKGKGPTRQSRRFCNRCQAELLMKDVRKSLDALLDA